jgi:hypothetical protein
MGKHTPGPWRDAGLDDENWYPGQIVNEAKRKTKIICSVPRDEYLGQSDDEDNEDRANARLIAASPELLASCQGIMESLELVLGPGCPLSTMAKDVVRGMFLGEIEKSKAAIEKAEGKL